MPKNKRNTEERHTKGNTEGNTKDNTKDKRVRGAGKYEIVHSKDHRDFLEELRAAEVAEAAFRVDSLGGPEYDSVSEGEAEEGPVAENPVYHLASGEPVYDRASGEPVYDRASGGISSASPGHRSGSEYDNVDQLYSDSDKATKVNVSLAEDFGLDVTTTQAVRKTETPVEKAKEDATEEVVEEATKLKGKKRKKEDDNTLRKKFNPVVAELKLRRPSEATPDAQLDNVSTALPKASSRDASQSRQ